MCQREGHFVGDLKYSSPTTLKKNPVSEFVVSDNSISLLSEHPNILDSSQLLSKYVGFF